MSADTSRRLVGGARLPRLALLGLSVALTGCEWFTDFKQQPKIDPWESPSDTIPPRGAPQFSVPITGSMLAGYQVSYAPLPGTIDSIGAAVTNPTPPSDSSLRNGRRYYAINCMVCHGANGAGAGPATQYGMPAINLLTDITKARTDGYIWGMMRNGRGLMPTYNRIEEMDRWDVVNYVRALQAGTADTGAVGLPGEGANTLPGYTRLAPTRPVPYYRPRRNALGAERNLLGDPAPGNDVAAPPGTGTPAATVPDTTSRTDERRGSAPPTPAQRDSVGPAAPARPPATAPDSARAARPPQGAPQ